MRGRREKGAVDEDLRMLRCINAAEHDRCLVGGTTEDYPTLWDHLSSKLIGAVVMGIDPLEKLGKRFAFDIADVAL